MDAINGKNDARLLYCDFAKKFYEVPSDYETNPNVTPRREPACCPACGEDICQDTMPYFHMLWRSPYYKMKELNEEVRWWKSKRRIRRK